MHLRQAQNGLKKQQLCLCCFRTFETSETAIAVLSDRQMYFAIT